MFILFVLIINSCQNRIKRIKRTGDHSKMSILKDVHQLLFSYLDGPEVCGKKSSDEFGQPETSSLTILTMFMSVL